MVKKPAHATVPLVYSLAQTDPDSKCFAANFDYTFSHKLTIE